MAENPLQIADSLARQGMTDQLFRAVVTGTNGSEAYIRRDLQAEADAASYPVASGLSLMAGDSVIVGRVGEDYVILVSL